MFFISDFDLQLFATRSETQWYSVKLCHFFQSIYLLVDDTGSIGYMRISTFSLNKSLDHKASFYLFEIIEDMIEGANLSAKKIERTEIDTVEGR